MNIKFYLLLIGLACSSTLLAQRSQVEIAAGIELGWWLHELGSTDPDVFNDLGVAKTHHSPAPFVSAAWLWSLGRWRVGPMIHGGALLEDDMRGPSDMRRSPQRIRIAPLNGNIPMLRYGLHLEYELIRRGGYSLNPAFRYGPLSWSTIHPDRDNFGYQQASEIIIHHVWHRQKVAYVLRMSYSTLQVFLKEKANPQEAHHLYFWGTSLGIRF